MIVKIKEPIYKKSCWNCKRAVEDPSEQYTCPKLEEHWKEYEKTLRKYE